MSKTRQKQSAVRITLLRLHTHAGRQHQAGETITVSAADARWLIEHGIGTAGATSNQEE